MKEVVSIVLYDFLVEVAVLASLNEGDSLPAVLVSANRLLGRLHILAEEEGLLG